jgi:hypothetical protein
LESDVARNEDADVKGPVSHVVSVLTMSLLPSVYLICRAAMKPALEPAPVVCCDGKFVANTVKTLVDGVRVTVNRCAYSQLPIVFGALLSKGGEPMYWPFTYRSKLLSAERRTVAEDAVLSDGATTVFLNPTVSAGASPEASVMFQIHELPVRFRGLIAGLGRLTLVPQGPDPYWVATSAGPNGETSTGRGKSAGTVPETSHVLSDRMVSFEPSVKKTRTAARRPAGFAAPGETGLAFAASTEITFAEALSAALRT